MEIRKLVVGPFEENCYILVCPETQASIIVDPGAEAEKVLANAVGTTVKLIVITHGHPDHVGALAEVQARLDVPVAYNPADASVISYKGEVVKLADGDTVKFGAVQLQVIHTPGHTPGSICLYTQGELIAGDTIFPGGPGHTRTPEDLTQIIESIRDKILVLPADTRIYSGHGISTTVGIELPKIEAFIARPRSTELCGDVSWEMGQES